MQSFGFLIYILYKQYMMWFRKDYGLSSLKIYYDVVCQFEVVFV
jgi:hypothetical protein